MKRALAAIAAWLLLGGNAHADLALPVTVEGERVTIHAEAGLEAQAAKLAPAADRDLARIESDLAGLPHVEHVEVRLVKHQQDLDAAAPADRGAPSWAAGTAYPDLGVVLVAARGADGDLFDMPRTLAHELAHMALDRALGEGRVPRWLTEGFAYLYSSDASWGRAQTLFGAMVRNKVIPIAALEDAFPREEREVQLAYAESYDFVAFLARRGRWQDHEDDGDRSAFDAFLTEIAHGKTLDAAAMTAYGRTIAQLEGEWYDTLRTRYLWYPLSALAGFIWVLGGALLTIGWLRRRRQKRKRLAEMAIEEAAAAATIDLPS
jgi:hypothetical protein